MSSEIERTQNFGNMLAKSRTDAGKTRKQMAQALGKSVTTIQNWESGIGEPGYRTLEKWFSVLGLNMEKYILSYRYPDKFLTFDKDTEIEKMVDCIHAYINTNYTERDIRQMAYCMFGDTGSSWHEQLNMLTANNHCSMRSRVNICQAVYDNFLMEKARGELVNEDNIMPDLASLNIALQRGREAACENKNGYTMTGQTRKNNDKKK